MSTIRQPIHDISIDYLLDCETKGLCACDVTVFWLTLALITPALYYAYSELTATVYLISLKLGRFGMWSSTLYCLYIHSFIPVTECIPCVCGLLVCVCVCGMKNNESKRIYWLRNGRETLIIGRYAEKMTCTLGVGKWIWDLWTKERYINVVITF